MDAPLVDTVCAMFVEDGGATRKLDVGATTRDAARALFGRLPDTVWHEDEAGQVVLLVARVTSLERLCAKASPPAPPVAPPVVVAGVRTSHVWAGSSWVWAVGLDSGRVYTQEEGRTDRGLTVLRVVQMLAAATDVFLVLPKPTRRPPQHCGPLAELTDYFNAERDRERVAKRQRAHAVHVSWSAKPPPAFAAAKDGAVLVWVSDLPTHPALDAYGPPTGTDGDGVRALLSAAGIPLPAPSEWQAAMVEWRVRTAAQTQTQALLVPDTADVTVVGFARQFALRDAETNALRGFWLQRGTGGFCRFGDPATSELDVPSLLALLLVLANPAAVGAEPPLDAGALATPGVVHPDGFAKAETSGAYFVYVAGPDEDPDGYRNRQPLRIVDTSGDRVRLRGAEVQALATLAGMPPRPLPHASRRVWTGAKIATAGLLALLVAGGLAHVYRPPTEAAEADVGGGGALVPRTAGGTTTTGLGGQAHTEQGGPGTAATEDTGGGGADENPKTTDTTGTEMGGTTDTTGTEMGGTTDTTGTVMGGMTNTTGTDIGGTTDNTTEPKTAEDTGSGGAEPADRRLLTADNVTEAELLEMFGRYGYTDAEVAAMPEMETITLTDADHRYFYDRIAFTLQNAVGRSRVTTLEKSLVSRLGDLATAPQAVQDLETGLRDIANTGSADEKKQAEGLLAVVAKDRTRARVLALQAKLRHDAKLRRKEMTDTAIQSLARRFNVAPRPLTDADLERLRRNYAIGDPYWADADKSTQGGGGIAEPGISFAERRKRLAAVLENARRKDTNRPFEDMIQRRYADTRRAIDTMEAAATDTAVRQMLLKWDHNRFEWGLAQLVCVECDWMARH